MNTAIQPKLTETLATCACGANYTILSTSDTLRLDICAACHPFYTGQQRYVDTEGRIEKFKTKFGSASQAIARNKAKKQKPQGPSEASAEAPSVAAEKAE